MDDEADKKQPEAEAPAKSKDEKSVGNLPVAEKSEVKEASKVPPTAEAAAKAKPKAKKKAKKKYREPAKSAP